MQVILKAPSQKVLFLGDPVVKRLVGESAFIEIVVSFCSTINFYRSTLFSLSMVTLVSFIMSSFSSKATTAKDIIIFEIAVRLTAELKAYIRS